MARVNVPVTDVAPVKASLTTTLSGLQNDLTFTAKAGGAWGDSIQIAYVDPGGVSADPLVVVEGFLITVNLGRAASAINTKASRVQSLIESSADARALVDVENAPSNDGSGIVTAMSATPLAGGTYGTTQAAVTNGDSVNGHYIRGNDGRVYIQVVSSDGSPRTVTIERGAAADPGATLEDEVVDVAAGATVDMGPFEEDEFNQNSLGDVYFTPSVSNTLDFRAKRVTRAT